MATLEEDISTSANWIAHALSNSGYAADFTPKSMWEIDRFLDEHSERGVAKPGGLLSQDLGRRIFAVGSYVGEVVRRTLGGRWVADDKDPEAEITVELQLPDGTRCWPVKRAMKRFRNGAEDGLAAWGSGMGLHVGPPPERSRKGLFRKLFG